MNAEVWRPVVGYEGLYEVSSQGQVRSLDREVQRGPGGRWTQPGRILRPGAQTSGHLRVVLAREGVHISRLVHHLVLEAFVGPRPGELEACHNNGIPADNRAENLRWDTRSSNVIDSVRHGTHNHASKTHCVNGHELTPENIYIARGTDRRHCKPCARDRAASQRRNTEMENIA